jgi:hypothetical protein
MTGAPSRAALEYARFLAGVVLVAAAIGAVGFVPTLRLGGAAAVRAMLAGCAVAVTASAIGGVPIALAGPRPADRPQAALLAMAARLLTVAILGLAAAASGRFAIRPLALWTVISYLAQLAVDSRYAMRAGAPPPASGTPAGSPATPVTPATPANGGER